MDTKPSQQRPSVEPTPGSGPPCSYSYTPSPPLSVEGREGSGVRLSDWNAPIGQVAYLCWTSAA